MIYIYNCMCIYMYFLSTVQFVQVKVTFLFAALCVPNIVTTFSPWQGYGCVLHLLQPFIERYSETCIIPWASYQIRKIAGCACAGNAGNVFPAPQVSAPEMHHVTHMPWCMPGSRTRGFLWIRWRGKHSRHSWRMRNSQFYVSGKRPIV